MKSGRLLLSDPEGWPLDIIEARQCESLDHEPRLATTTLYWVDGPIDYCDRCAAAMKQVGEVLGFHCHTEPIAPPPELALIQRRAIDLKGDKL